MASLICKAFQPSQLQSIIDEKDIRKGFPISNRHLTNANEELKTWEIDWRHFA